MSEANLVDKQLIKKLILKHGNLNHDYNETNNKFGLTFNSKTGSGSGKGRTDFVIWNKEKETQDYIVIAECKKGFNNLDKALEEAKQYVKDNEHLNLKLVPMGVVDYGDDIVLKIEHEGKIYTTINSIYHKAHSNIPIQDVQKLAEVIHNKLRKTAISPSDYPIILDAFILFCKYSGVEGVKVLGKKKDKLGYIYLEIVQYLKDPNFDKEILPVHKRDQVIEIFNIVNIHQSSSNTNIISEIVEMLIGERAFDSKKKLKYNFVQAITEGITGDLIGELYMQFSSYSSDGKKKGIVFTPQDIIQLMMWLGKYKLGDKVYDPTMGSGSFLVECLNEGLLSINSLDNNNEIKKQMEHEFKLHNLFGCENDSRIFLHGICNMILRGDGKAGVENIDCRKHKLTDKVDLVLMNPPFAMDKDQSKDKDDKETEIVNGYGLVEWDFVRHALDQLKVGGRLICIFPTSCMLDKRSKERQKILSNHTLKTVVSLSQKVFHGQAGIHPCIVELEAHKPHDFNEPIRLIDFSDDGFRVKKHIGRVNIDWESKFEQFKIDYKRFEENERVKKYYLENYDDEVIYELMLKCESITEDDLLQSIKDYICYEVQNGD